jgi:hypothetical protein
MTTSEEHALTQALSTAQYQQATNILIEADSVQELTLRPGEGMSVKQITSSTIGSFGWLLVYTLTAL